MKHLARVIGLVLLLAWPVIVAAQAEVHVEATLDSTTMFIGEQTQLSITVTHPEGQNVAWPSFAGKQLVHGVEIVKNLPATTHAGAHKGTAVTQKKLVLTSFDPALYSISPIRIKVGGRNLQTEPLALKVNDVEVDTTHVEKYFGPKDVITPTYTWAEWRPVFFLSLLLVVLLALLLVLLRSLERKEPVVVVKPRPVEQPYAWALRMIQQFRHQYEQGRYEPKDYYTRLVDILRGYLHRRYRIRASEMTSAQILEQLDVLADEADRQALRHLLQTADLVKFAKMHTSGTEDEQNLLKMSEFVEASKLDVPSAATQADAAQENEEPTEAEAQNAHNETLRLARKRKRRLLWVIACGAAFVAVLVGVIVNLIKLL